MADLATNLLRTVARAFYTTEHVLVIDALILHSTLPDSDLAYVLGMQPKALRKICGRLREDGLLSIHQRAERKTDGSQSFYGSSAGQQGKERVTMKDWYYLNFHRAIDSIKYRMYRLSKHVESLGASTTEKKDLICPRPGCRSQYTELEVMDRIDFTTGAFLCRKCGHPLDPVKEDERVNENESMKRLNSQLEKVLRLMQQIDAATVPENDFDTALSKQKPIVRTDTNPGQQRTEIVDMPNRNLQSTKGLDIKPEKIAVQVQDDADVRKESEASEAAAKREKEARQNMLPDWIAKSTVSGDITAVGAKEERLRQARGAGPGPAVLGTVASDNEEKKPAVTMNWQAEDDVMNSYWQELAKAQEQEAAERQKSEDEGEEEDDDEDEFEDVDVSGAGSIPPLRNGAGAANGNRNGTIASTSGANTPALESSNATDDERDTKRVRIEEPTSFSSKQVNGDTVVNGKVAEDTPAASDEDEDELEFENV